MCREQPYIAEYQILNGGIDVQRSQFFEPMASAVTRGRWDEVDEARGYIQSPKELACSASCQRLECASLLSCPLEITQPV